MLGNYAGFFRNSRKGMVEGWLDGIETPAGNSMVILIGSPLFRLQAIDTKSEENSTLDPTTTTTALVISIISCTKNILYFTVLVFCARKRRLSDFAPFQLFLLSNAC